VTQGVAVGVASVSDNELEPGPYRGVTQGVAVGVASVMDNELEPGPYCGVTHGVATPTPTARRLDPSVPVAAVTAIAAVTERLASAARSTVRRLWPIWTTGRAVEWSVVCIATSSRGPHWVR
jgi:hypothetical protein